MRTARFPSASSLVAKLGLLLVAPLLGLALTATDHPAEGAEPAKAPAKKDSRPFFKSKNATLTASVEPAEVAPGEEVTYRVTAKLKPGYHIYAYSKKPIENGPVPTNFDFFDPAGFTISGDWQATKKPIEHPEPAFNNLVVQFYEDEVSWSIKLKVPSDAQSGKHTLLCQVQYMICDAKSCSPPGQWTLPPVTVNVGGGAAKTDAAASPLLATSAVVKESAEKSPASADAPQKPASPSPADAPASKPAQASTAKPKVADSRPIFRSKNATLTTFVAPEEVAPGGEVTYRVTAKMKPGYHIYAYAKTKDAKGPEPTSFDFFGLTDFTVAGDWVASKSPAEHPDPNFDNAIVKYHEDEVSWSIKLRVPADATPGKRDLLSQARYMICNDKSCSQIGQWTLPAVTVTVASAAPSTPTVAAIAPAAAKPTPSEPTRPAPAVTSADAPKPVEAESAPKVESADTKTVAVTEPKTVTGALPADTVIVKAADTKPVQSEIAQAAQQGLLPFLIASAIGGLFALVMPCVWPMVPITVNFFIKQGQKDKAKTTGLAVVYCLAIIGIFTTVGVLFSFFISASALQTLANNSWLNLAVAGLFLAFGLSLLGLFEIRLPSFLLNASAQGEGRGGLVGVFFMALTLTITSFTCTFPVVGGLLVMAAGGNFLYPILGLATFAAVVALPFFLLALAPGLLAKMPKSGDWMNTVKVVGGLIEIGAALKFINTAELGYVVPEDAWFDAQVILTAWIAISAVCGIYLLGLFRTDHDHDDVKVGPARMVFGIGFLGFALYLMPALFGRPPQSLIWDRLIVGILPPDSNELAAAPAVAIAASGGATGTSADAGHETSATSSDPEKAQREQKSVHGVAWGMSLDQAKELAQAEKKPILIDFTGINCANCRLMERRVLPKPEVVGLLKQFVTVQLYTDRVPIKSISAEERQALAEKNQMLQYKLTADVTNPFYVVLSPSGELISVIGGYNEPGVFTEFLSKALDKSRDVTKVAQTGRGE